MFGKKKQKTQELAEAAPLEEIRGQSLIDLLEEHAPAARTDLPPARPRGRSQHYRKSPTPR